MATDALDEAEKLGDAGIRGFLASMARTAKRVAAAKRWAGSNPLGTAAALEDFVADTIASVVGGDRPWSRTDGHNLRQHLFQSLKSEIDQRATEKENSVREVPPDDEERSSPANTTDDIVASHRFADLAAKELCDAAGDDVVLKGIADLFLSGYEDPEDFSAKLNLPKKEINGALQKFRRRLDKRGALPRLKESLA